MSARTVNTRSLGGPEEEFDRLRSQVSAMADKIREFEATLKRMATKLPPDQSETLLAMKRELGGLRKNQGALADAMHGIGEQFGHETSTRTLKGRLGYAAGDVMKSVKHETVQGLRAMSDEGRKLRDALANWRFGLVVFFVGFLFAFPVAYAGWSVFQWAMPEEARIAHARIAFDTNARYTAMRVLADKYGVRPTDMFTTVLGAAAGNEVLEECRARADAVQEKVACSLPIEVYPSSYWLDD